MELPERLKEKIVKFDLSDEVKEKMRAELVRRKTFETAATTRTAILKALGAALFVYLLAAMALWQLNGLPHRPLRLACVAVLGFAFPAGILYSLIAYVRFRDWRQMTNPAR